MIAGWLAKIVVVIALLGFAAVELGSPLWTRAQLDGIANDAADEAARRWPETTRAREAAEEQAEDGGAVLTRFETPSVTNGQKIVVTVYRDARSYLLHRFGPTKDWYAVSVTASAEPEL